jgi:hypothetical protein
MVDKKIKENYNQCSGSFLENKDTFSFSRQSAVKSYFRATNKMVRERSEKTKSVLAFLAT